LDCEMFVVPRLFEMSYTTRDMDQAWGTPLVRVRRAPTGPSHGASSVSSTSSSRPRRSSSSRR
jgi:hypothetical protein